jgi:hypothetical protein
MFLFRLFVRCVIVSGTVADVTHAANAYWWPLAENQISVPHYFDNIPNYFYKKKKKEMLRIS